MNLKRKSISILLVLIFIASTISDVSAEDVDYSLKEGIVDLFVEEMVFHM